MNKLNSTRRLAGLALAACLILGLQAVGYGCGAAGSGCSHGTKIGCNHGSSTTTGDTTPTVTKSGCPHAGTTQITSGTAEHHHALKASHDLSYVYTTEQLYTCPMHPEIVTPDADQPCTVCKMQLRKLSDGEMLELRASEPKGCPMCSFVVPGDSEHANCPGCDMKLMPVPQQQPLQNQKPAGM